MLTSRTSRTPRRSVLRIWSLITTLLVAVAGLSVLTAPPAAATHYRATQIGWKSIGGKTVEFDVTASFRCTFFFSSPCSASPGDTFNADAISFGDGTAGGGTYTVVTVDQANDVITAESEATHTYPTTKAYTAAIDTCCRLSGPQHVNNPDGSVRVETVVWIAKTSGNPGSAIAPIVDCPIGGVCSFTVPASDRDNPDLSFRMATGAESDLTQPGPPFAPNAASIDPDSGLYTWDTTGARLSSSGDTFYSTQVMVLDKVNGQVVTKTPVDFFIRLSAGTNRQPVFIRPTPADGATIAATVGQRVSFNVKANDSNAGDQVDLGIVDAPAGSTLTPIPPGTNPATATFAWTPSAAGTYPMVLTATDQDGLGAVPRGVTIDVAPAGAPALSVADASVREGNPPASRVMRFVLSLDKPASRDVSVTYMTEDRSAQSGRDYQGVFATRTIPAGATSITVPVHIISDRVKEPNENFWFKVTQVTGGAVIAKKIGVGRIVNDDGVTS